MNKKHIILSQGLDLLTTVDSGTDWFVRTDTAVCRAAAASVIAAAVAVDTDDASPRSEESKRRRRTALARLRAQQRRHEAGRASAGAEAGRGYRERALASAVALDTETTRAVVESGLRVLAEPLCSHGLLARGCFASAPPLLRQSL